MWRLLKPQERASLSCESPASKRAVRTESPMTRGSMTIGCGLAAAEAHLPIELTAHAAQNRHDDCVTSNRSEMPTVQFFRDTGNTCDLPQRGNGSRSFWFLRDLVACGHSV